MIALSSGVPPAIEANTSANVNGRSLSDFAVACPSCEYLLHNVGGPVVRCPECGATCDVEELARRYRRTWSTTPLYERMNRPVLVALLLVILAPAVWVMMLYEVDRFLPIGFILLCALLGALAVTWLALALLAMRGLLPGEGGKLLLLLHAAMAGYFICGLGVFAGLIGLVMLPVAIINDAADVQAVAACAVVVAIGMLSAIMFRPLWKLDQRVGQASLRHSLHEWAAEGQSGEPDKGRQ